MKKKIFAFLGVFLVLCSILTVYASAMVKPSSGTNGTYVYYLLGGYQDCGTYSNYWTDTTGTKIYKSDYFISPVIDVTKSPYTQFKNIGVHPITEYFSSTYDFYPSYGITSIFYYGLDRNKMNTSTYYPYVMADGSILRFKNNGNSTYTLYIDNSGYIEIATFKTNEDVIIMQDANCLYFVVYELTGTYNVTNVLRCDSFGLMRSLCGSIVNEEIYSFITSDKVMAGYQVGFNDGYAQGHTDGAIYGETLNKDVWIEVGRQEGESQGYTIGYDDGHEDGYNEGYGSAKTTWYQAGLDEGYENGHNEGYTLGFSEGESKGWENGRNEGYRIGFEEGLVQGDSNGYSRGYGKGQSDGYNSGKIDGIEIGHERGYQVGYDEGYEIGLTNSYDYDDLENYYNIGYLAGQDTNGIVSSSITGFFSAVGGFFEPLLSIGIGSLTLYTVLALAVIIAVVTIIIKIVRDK